MEEAPDIERRLNHASLYLGLAFSSRFRLGTMLFYVSLGRFSRVMRCVSKVPLRCVRVMGRGFVVPTVMMLRRLAVMTCGVIVVFRGFAVMFCSFLGHILLLCDSFLVSPDQEAETRELYHVGSCSSSGLKVARVITFPQTTKSTRLTPKVLQRHPLVQQKKGPPDEFRE